MAMSESALEALIFQQLQSEVGGTGPTVIENRQKLAKALANAIVKFLRAALQDSQGGKCF